MRRTYLLFAFIVLTFAATICSCATTRFKPCTDGGQAARESTAAPIQGGIKRCYHVTDKSGYTFNHGKYMEWYSSDKIAITGEYKMGKKTGRWIEFDENGKKTSDKYFADGKEVAAP